MVNSMSILSDSFSKIKKRLSGVASALPDKAALRKGTKAAAILSTIVVAGKLGHDLYKKVDKKVNVSVDESKNNALTEIKITINKNLEKFIFECVFRWIIYIALIFFAYVAAKYFHLRKDVLVAFVILGIYSFYAIKIMRMLHWYVSFCSINGLMFNPARIIRAYLHKSILARVKSVRDGLSFPDRLALNFFGPDNEKIASDITDSSLHSADLKWEAITRLGMWACGWLIYSLIYEKLFLVVTGIDFNAFWEPFLWPFHIFLN